MFLRRILPLMVLIFLGACGASGKRTDVPPPQDSVNQVLAGVVDDTEAVAALFIGLPDCDAFFQFVSQIPESVSCEQGGSAQVVVSDSSCVEEPEPRASVTFVRTSQQCTFQGKSTSGSLTTTLLLEGGQLQGIVAAEGIVIIGIRFNFFDLMIPLNDQAVAQNCSGMATAFDFPCELSSDCQTCPLMD